jgi:hypothetical protein
MPYLNELEILHGAVSAEQRVSFATPCRLITSCVCCGSMFVTVVSIRDCKVALSDVM